MSFNLDKLKRQLLKHEGIRLKPYRCTAGKLTIGIGRNLDDVGITEDEAFALLEFDIKRTVEALQDKPYFQAVHGDDVRTRVIVDMAFNLGVEGLDKFKRTMDAVVAKDFERAAEYMLQSKWASQVSGRAVKLAQMMKTGLDVYAR